MKKSIKKQSEIRREINRMNAIFEYARYMAYQGRVYSFDAGGVLTPASMDSGGMSYADFKRFAHVSENLLKPAKKIK